MKTLIKTHFGFLLVVVLLSGCFKDQDTLRGIPTRDITTYTLRSMYTSSAVKLTNANIGAARLAGTVISDVASGNTNKGQFVIVQSKNGITSGITITVQNSPNITLALGDSVVIDVLGGTLTRKQGALQVTDVSLDKITKVASNCRVDPIIMTLGELSKNFDKYEGMLVQVAGTDVSPVPATGDTYAGDKGLYDGSVAAGAVKLSTLSTANFASEKIPANANFTGIATYYNSNGDGAEGASQLIRMRAKTDVTITSAPLNADLVITGYMADPRGSDAPVAGTSSAYSNGVKVVHKGSYEYIQLMALRDIDFAVTPYAVVTCQNGSATANGWAQGGTNTFKFNLTSGTAKAGTFIYVGGPGQVIGGYWNCGPTADISSANWIRVINTPTVGGDDFGAAGGILGNMAGDGSNVADGIAVFKGTTVTSTSVPIDAIFYGTKITTSYNAANGWGFRIPLNDHYNPVDPETGAAQPFFGQGTNTYMFTQPASDVGDFSKLGGVASAGAWLLPRSTTSMVISTSSCSVSAAFTLTNIESGSGVTYFRK